MLVTGGAGYVGAALVPNLLEPATGSGARPVPLWRRCLAECRESSRARADQGRHPRPARLERRSPGCDAVIHLACISNDPSFELDPALGNSINYAAFLPLVSIAKDAGVRRFIYASSSSVYGVKADADVTEDLPLEPLTDYSRFKAMCEEVLLGEREPGFAGVILRPATVCGYSPRLRLDLTVNILTNLAINTGRITVFGGEQKRPNIHIDDMADLYLHLLAAPDDAVNGRIFNAGYENHKVRRDRRDGARGGRHEIAIVATPPTTTAPITSPRKRSRASSVSSRGARLRMRSATCSAASAPAGCRTR